MLRANSRATWRRKPAKGSVPFKLAELQPEFGGEDLGVLYQKWERDGWQRRRDNYGTNHEIKNASKYTVACDGDDGWQNRPSRKHPSLIARYVGHLDHGYTFRFALDGFDELLDDNVDSACWENLGNLVYSREGILYKYSLDDLKNGRPGTVHDLEPFAQHDQRAKAEATYRQRRYASSVRIDMCLVRINCRVCSNNGELRGRDSGDVGIINYP